jgi:benzil reductase ((S)-benzoin forming)
MDYYYVTGTSRGLGRALVDELLQDVNATVVGIGRSEGPTHERYRHVTLDLANVAAVGELRFGEHADAGRIVLVNNAASLVLSRVGDAEPGEIAENFNINVVAPTILMNAFVAAYRAMAAELVICNITTNAATEPIESAFLYGGPKAALELVTRTIDNEAKLAGATQLTAFCINPGSMDTGMQAYLRSFDVSEWGRSEMLRQRYDQGLVVAPETVAAAITRVLRNPSLAPGPVFWWNEVAG